MEGGSFFLSFFFFFFLKKRVTTAPVHLNACSLFEDRLVISFLIRFEFIVFFSYNLLSQGWLAV
jgi:hypothetical protein